MKKVCILIPSLGAGGAERILVNVLNQLDLADFEVDLFIGFKGGALEKDIPSEVNVSYLYPNRFFARMYSFLFRKFGMEWGYGNLKSKVSKSYDVAISYLDGPFTQFLVNTPKEVFRKKYSVIHSSYLSFSDVSGSVQSEHFKRMKRRYESLDGIISVSHEAKKEFNEVFGDHIPVNVIYNPLNVTQVIKKGNEMISFSKEDNIFNLAIVGSLLPVKGHERLLKSLAEVKKAGNEFHLWIVGDGPLRESLIKKQESLGLNEEVTFLGFQSNPYPIIKNADAMVVSSFSEGLPTVVCEALILHTPVISTNITGCREVLENGKYGLMVEDSEAGLISGISEMISSPELQNKFKDLAKERAQFFDDEKMLENYRKLFAGLI